jgi:hypothetical protein
MKALATVLRILATLSLAGLAGVIWMKWETFTIQTNAFLDEVTDISYVILQAEQDKTWEQIDKKKSEFYEIFDANDPVDQNDENPLAISAESIKSSESVLLKKPEYREGLESSYLEFGANSLTWAKEAKQWEKTSGESLTPPSSFTDPFIDESKFPKETLKLEDGTVIPAVPRPNRLRTVVGMFYKDRDEKFKEISKLREMVVMRDRELREFQNLYAKEKARKEELETEVGELSLKIEGLEADLRIEKEERLAEKEAAETKISNLERNVAELEEQKIEIGKKHEEFVDQLKEEHNVVIAGLQDEIRKAGAEGYKRGVDEMVAKQQGGEVEKSSSEVSVNPFLPSDEGPPKLTQAEMMLAAQATEITDVGVPSTVGRVDGKMGMILLPLGSERGVSLGNVYTLWKENKKAARIRIQSVSQGFSLAYLLPQFGNPQNLRPGDSVHVVPEKEETL